MLAGKFHEMKVERQTPLGYTLSLDGEEYFLHQAEVTRDFEVGEDSRSLSFITMRRNV